MRRVLMHRRNGVHQHPRLLHLSPTVIRLDYGHGARTDWHRRGTHSGYSRLPTPDVWLVLTIVALILVLYLLTR